MDRLIALPVKGESFFLEKQRRRVLVDSGYSGTSLFSALLQQDPALTILDVVVCTHGDRDHAGGLGDFLDRWCRPTSTPGKTRRVRELWLPGRWADVLGEVLLSPRKFADALLDALDEVVSDPEKVRWLEWRVEDVQEGPLDSDTGEAVSAEESDFQEDHWGEWSDADELDIHAQDHFEEPSWLSDLRRNAERIQETPAEAYKAFLSARRRVQYRRRVKKIDTKLAEFWLELIETAKNIRAIAASAIRHSIRIRWFDFEAFASTRVPKGGLRGLLMPLNSVEQAPAPRIHLHLIARLSRINETCLAFLSPPRFNSLGVLFCGDSPLGDGPGYKDSFFTHAPRVRRPLIATAPHHGSESNAIAYSHLNRWAFVVAWVRTGGSKRHPGPTFKRLTFPSRACTHCPQVGLSLQPVVVGLGAWPWRPASIGGHHCRC